MLIKEKKITVLTENEFLREPLRPACPNTQITPTKIRGGLTAGRFNDIHSPASH